MALPVLLVLLHGPTATNHATKEPSDGSSLFSDFV
jgi:hypothetical protein